MDGSPVPFEARKSSSDPPPPILGAALEIAPLTVRLFFDQDVTRIPLAALDAWKIIIDGLRRDAVSLVNDSPATLVVVAAAGGFPIPGRFVNYSPPTDSVQGPTGVPAASASGVPIAP